MAKKTAKPAAKGGKKTLKGSSKVGNTKVMMHIA
jgi:hypothetical protein